MRRRVKSVKQKRVTNGMVTNSRGRRVPANQAAVKGRSVKSGKYVRQVSVRRGKGPSGNTVKHQPAVDARIATGRKAISKRRKTSMATRSSSYMAKPVKQKRVSNGMVTNSRGRRVPANQAAVKGRSVKSGKMINQVRVNAGKGPSGKTVKHQPAVDARIATGRKMKRRKASSAGRSTSGRFVKQSKVTNGKVSGGKGLANQKAVRGWGTKTGRKYEQKAVVKGKAGKTKANQRAVSEYVTARKPKSKSSSSSASSSSARTTTKRRTTRGKGKPVMQKEVRGGMIVNSRGRRMPANQASVKGYVRGKSVAQRAVRGGYVTTKSGKRRKARQEGVDGYVAKRKRKSSRGRASGGSSGYGKYFGGRTPRGATIDKGGIRAIIAPQPRSYTRRPNLSRRATGYSIDGGIRPTF